MSGNSVSVPCRRCIDVFNLADLEIKYSKHDQPRFLGFQRAIKSAFSSFLFFEKKQACDHITNPKLVDLIMLICLFGTLVASYFIELQQYCKFP